MAAALLQPIASWLHHLSPLRERRLIFHPVRCQLPRGFPASPLPSPIAFFHFICQNLCHAATLSCPLAPRKQLAATLSAIACLCWHRPVSAVSFIQVGAEGRNNKQRMFRVNTLVSVTPPDSLQLTPLTWPAVLTLSTLLLSGEVGLSVDSIAVCYWEVAAAAAVGGAAEGGEEGSLPLRHPSATTHWRWFMAGSRPSCVEVVRSPSPCGRWRRREVLTVQSHAGWLTECVCGCAKARELVTHLEQPCEFFSLEFQKNNDPFSPLFTASSQCCRRCWAFLSKLSCFAELTPVRWCDVSALGDITGGEGSNLTRKI